MSRLALVMVVAVLNLGLGFLAACCLGRGPRWRRAGRRATPQPTGPSASQDSAATTMPQAATKSLPVSNENEVPLLEFLEQAEQTYEGLLKKFLSATDEQEQLREILTTVEQTLQQLQAAIAAYAALGGESEDFQAFDSLRESLESTRDTLRSGPNSTDGSAPDPVDLAELLMTRCRESRGALVALQFAGM